MQLARLFLTISVLISGSNAVFAQEPTKNDLSPCGTAPFTDPWLTDYFERPGELALARSSDTIWVGMQVHLVGRDNGTGRFSAERLLDAFCRLNEDYGPAGIRFFFKYDWHYIDSTAWFQHEDIVDGINMMFENNQPDALNIYFVSDPAGNCGYNIPYAGIAISHGCAGPNDHTWAHEVGHALTLQHPFIGWEGKLYNYNTPTPTSLTYDYTHFHAQPDTIDPAPLDTALVEYTNGSNCYEAADKFCDTPPDYLSYRWDCNAQGFSLVKQKDPNGVDFYSDGSLFMSYASDICSNRFSDEQIAAMRANLYSVKQAWLAPGQVAGFIDGVTTLESPVNGQLVPSVGFNFQWTSVPGATQYLIQVSRFSSFTIKEVDQVTSDTFFTAGQLSPNKNYYWRVRPFNNTISCTDFSATGSFKTDLVNGSISSGQAGDIRCYPSLISAGSDIQLELTENWLNRPVQCRIYDPAGRLVFSQEQRFNQSQNRLNWLEAQQMSGIYRIVLHTEETLRSLPVAVMR